MNTLTKPTPAAPIALLRDLDTWMANTGHDQEHPWRAAILDTLQAYSVAGDCSQAAVPVVPTAAGGLTEAADEVLGALCNARAMALAIGGLMEQIDPCGPAETAPYGYAVEACLAQLDQQSDAALKQLEPLRALVYRMAAQ